MCPGPAESHSSADTSEFNLLATSQPSLCPPLPTSPALTPAHPSSPFKVSPWQCQPLGAPALGALTPSLSSSEGPSSCRRAEREVSLHISPRAGAPHGRGNGAQGKCRTPSPGSRRFPAHAASACSVPAPLPRPAQKPLAGDRGAWPELVPAAAASSGFLPAGTETLPCSFLWTSLSPAECVLADWAGLSCWPSPCSPQDPELALLLWTHQVLLLSMARAAGKQRPPGGGCRKALAMEAERRTPRSRSSLHGR